MQKRAIATKRVLLAFAFALVLGVSRKSFIGRLAGADVDKRLPGSLACACWAVLQGVQILRTHDVAETLQAVRLTESLVKT